MKGVGPGRVRDILDHEPRYVRVERQRRYLLTGLPEGVSPRDEHAQINRLQPLPKTTAEPPPDQQCSCQCDDDQLQARWPHSLQRSRSANDDCCR